MRRLPVLLVALGLAVALTTSWPWLTGGHRQAPSRGAESRADRAARLHHLPVSGPTRDTATRPHPRTPARLRVWHYDAPVVPISPVAGVLTPPPDADVLGWWGRPACARHGATVLTGHTVGGVGGAFGDLDGIPLGARGTLSGCPYRVAAVRVLSKARLAALSAALFSQAGEPRLLLVTCNGYDPATREYADNTVVVLRPAGEPQARQGQQ